MKLHQFLRFFQPGNPICIFDISGIEICQVTTKADIDRDLYEYDILEICLGIIGGTKSNKHCLYITIQK